MVNGTGQRLVMTTKKKYWPGQNVMGKLLSELRTMLKQKDKSDKKISKSQELTQKSNETDTESEYDYC